MHLERWPGRRILAVWTCWIACVELVLLAGLEFSTRQLIHEFQSTPGSGGLAVVGYPRYNPLGFVILLAPPALLTTAWFAQRRRHSKSPETS